MAAPLGDELNSVHFDWEKAYEEGSLDDHFKVALIDVNYSAAATSSSALRIFYQEMHEYDPDWIVERFLCCALHMLQKLRSSEKQEPFPFWKGE